MCLPPSSKCSLSPSLSVPLPFIWTKQEQLAALNIKVRCGRRAGGGLQTPLSDCAQKNPEPKIYRREHTHIHKTHFCKIEYTQPSQGFLQGIKQCTNSFSIFVSLQMYNSDIFSHLAQSPPSKSPPKKGLRLARELRLLLQHTASPPSISISYIQSFKASSGQYEGMCPGCHLFAAQLSNFTSPGNSFISGPGPQRGRFQQVIEITYSNVGRRHSYQPLSLLVFVESHKVNLFLLRGEKNFVFPVNVRHRQHE